MKRCFETYQWRKSHSSSPLSSRFHKCLSSQPSWMLEQKVQWMKIGSSHRFFCTSYLLAAWLNTRDLNTFTAQKIKDYSVLFCVSLSHSDVGWLPWSKSVLWLLCIHCMYLVTGRVWAEWGMSHHQCSVFIWFQNLSISALLENSELHQLEPSVDAGGWEHRESVRSVRTEHGVSVPLTTHTSSVCTFVLVLVQSF